MEEYKIDIPALIKEIINDSMNQILLNSMPVDDDTKKQFSKILTAFNRRGVSTQTVIEVFMEAFKEE